MLLRLLNARRASKERVRREAADLITFLGAGAYLEARGRARHCRMQDDRAGYRHWSRVAVEVARRTGRRIGEKAADRRAADTPDLRRSVQHSAEVRRAVEEIGTDLAALARGRDDAATLHNGRARALQAAELAGDAGRARKAAEALCEAAAALVEAREENAAALAAGAYPPALDAACRALEGFKGGCT